MEPFVYLLALVWGGVWACVLQFTPIGHFLAVRRTWLTVSIGVGVDLALLSILLDLSTWIKVGLIVGLSSAGVIIRSLYNEFRVEKEILDVVKNPGVE